MKPDPQALRIRLVQHLLATGALRPGRVERALETVPRHIFIPRVSLETAYSDQAVVTHHDALGQPTSSSSQPSIMALMLQQLNVQAGDHVLEIGAGTGYNAALLAHLATETGRVSTVDIDPQVAEEARRHLGIAGVDGVETVNADGWIGLPDHAPYQRIQVAVGVSDISPAWFEQLEDGGKLVLPLWLRAGVQVSVGFHRKGDQLHSTTVIPCGFMMLRGPFASLDRYLHVDEWYATCDTQGDSSRIESLRKILDLPPRVTDAPQLAKDWFTALALHKPDAIALTRGERTRKVLARGLFNSTANSLALVISRPGEPDRLYVYGDGMALEQLHNHFLHGEHVDLPSLDISVSFSGKPVQTDERTITVLRRRHSTMHVRRNSSAGNTALPTLTSSNEYV